MARREGGESITVPAWLNNEFVSDVLAAEKGKDVYVIDYDVNNVVPKGDNYLSSLFRISARYKTTKDDDIKQYTFIIKALPEGKMMQKFLSELDGFHKELNIYTVALPEIYRLMQQSEGQVHLLAPRHLLCKKENVIVLEDLNQRGYKMGDRQAGLDFNHCKITLRALARLHVTSFAVYKSDPRMMEVFKEGMYKNKKEADKFKQSIFSANFNSLASKVETWEGYEHFAPKLREFQDTALDKMVDIVKPKKDCFNVLNHGDCWVNNILFRHNSESGEVEDVRFVDFQISRFSSPALDLQYFICSSPTDDVRFQQRDAMLEVYHREMADCFKALNLHSELMSLNELREEFYEKDIFGFITASTVLSAVLADKEDMPEMGEIKEDHVEKTGKSVFDKAYSGRRYRDVYQKMLLYYENRGLI